MRLTDSTYEDKYKFYCDNENKQVICVTWYKGSSIKGIAKCDPDDAFDIETGKQLAYWRCRYKFLKRKAARAADAYAKAVGVAARAEAKRKKAIEFIEDVAYELTSAKHELAGLEKSLEA